MKVTVLIGTIGLALGGSLGYYTLYAPKQEQVRLIHAQVAQAQADQQAQEDVSVLLKQLEQYRKRLPPSPDPSWLAREAVSLGRQAGLEFETISPAAPREFSQFTHLTVDLQFRTTYHALGLFLDDIERAPSFLRVERLLINNQDGAGGSVIISLTLGTLYVSPVVPTKAGGLPTTPQL